MKKKTQRIAQKIFIYVLHLTWHDRYEFGLGADYDDPSVMSLDENTEKDKFLTYLLLKYINALALDSRKNFLGGQIFSRHSAKNSPL